MLILKTIAKKSSKIFLAVFVFAVFVSSAQANVIFDPPGNNANITDLTTKITNWFLSVTAGVAVLFLIVGGIYYITSLGDDHRMEEAKKIITYTVYGLILVLISYSVVLTINNIIFE